MIDAYRPGIWRVIASAAATIVVLSGFALPAAAKQVASSIPVFGIDSLGSAVATRDALTVSNLILNVGYAGPQQIKFLFELDGHGDNSLRFLGGYPDSACHTVGSAPATAVECVYTRDIVVNEREHFSFRHKSTRPGTSGLTTLWITISIAGASARNGLQIKGVAPEADLVVGVTGPGAGRIGDVVEFTWSLTNAGLDPVFDRSGVVIFVAPPGTEFADSLANTEPDDMICQVSGDVKTHRVCWFGVIQPGQARKEKWRLRILSDRSGEGKVEAMLSNFTGKHPEGDYKDPTPGNNVAAIRVRLMPGGGTASDGLPLPASTDPTAFPSPDPTSPSESPTTPAKSADTTALPLPASSSSANAWATVGWSAAAIGLAALLALLVSVMLRRRRSAASQPEAAAVTSEP